MKNPYEMFATDLDKEVNGIEVDFGDFSFRVARAAQTNQRYAKALEAAARPHKRAIQTETISKEVVRQINMEAFVNGCLLGWTNVRDAQNELLPFNAENARQLFTDLPDLYDVLVEAAKDAALFRKVVNEDTAGN